MSLARQESEQRQDGWQEGERRESHGPSVTLVGLGPMGRAMAGAYLDAGYAVTLWNRSPGRADGLLARGAVLAPDAAAAFAANDLVVLSLADYDAVFAVLAAAEPELAGKVVVDLGTGTPARAREVARWLAERGAGHLTGGVQVPPSGIGRPESSSFYSGPVELFRRHRADLEVLTGADYRGDDPGLAQLHHRIRMDRFWTSLTAYLHATALMEASGAAVDEFPPRAASAGASGRGGAGATGPVRPFQSFRRE
ncbi:NAD(P)-dependent oxidoreductase [Kitasatospora sp. NPDC094019]|uniref:NAD(P)-dependent oxidoreductase n=1 Tax=Kitasatospora sp. NPDC094019 TaxID=3364091 RepID=UPI00380AD1F0